MPDAYICGRLWRTKITRKASDAAEYIAVVVVVTFNKYNPEKLIEKQIGMIVGICSRMANFLYTRTALKFWTRSEMCSKENVVSPSSLV